MPQPLAEPDFNLLYYWRIVVRSRWIILSIVLSSMILTGIYTMLQPKLYEAKAVLLPAREESMSGGGMSMGGGGGRGGTAGGGGGGGGASAALEALGGKGSAVLDSLTAILVSRTMAESVATELNLTQYYGVNSVRAAAAAVRREMEPKSTKYKSLEIVVTSKDPVMAAQIANTYAAVLDRMNKELTITATKRVRQYVEGRLADRAQSLAAAENAVKKFQDENRVRVAMGGEGGEGGQQGDVSVIGGLASQILSLEVELAALREYTQPNHPMVIQLEAQIRELRRQVDRVEQERVRGIENASKKRTVPMSKKLYPSFEETTALNFEAQALARRLKVEEAVYGSLVGMLESAKLAEAKDLPTVQVLDAALPPEGPTKPDMRYNLTAAGVLSLLFGVLLAIFLDYIDRLRAQDQALVQLAAGQMGVVAIGPNGNGVDTVVHLASGDELMKKAGNGREEDAYPSGKKKSEPLHG